MANGRKMPWLGVLAALVAVAAIGAGGIAVLRMDCWGDRDGSPRDAEVVPRIAPALIRYQQEIAFPVGLKEARALAVGSDDRIYVGGDKRIRVFNRDGTPAREIVLDGPPQCLAIAAGDAAEPARLVVGMEQHVELYRADGQRTEVWKSLGAEASLTAVAATEQDVFAADAGNHVVWHYDASGKLLRAIGRPDKARNYPGFLPTRRYFDMALGGDGLLHVVNPRALRVEAYTFAGDLEFTWGQGSPKLDGFFGCCNPAYLAALGDGRFVTMEKGARRVKIYSPQGKLKCVVAGPDQLGAEPGAVAADRHGRILVLDPAAAMVRIFSPFAGEGPGVRGMRRKASAKDPREGNDGPLPRSSSPTPKPTSSNTNEQ